MKDLEQRLRYTLHELSDTVPRSENPKADFERRLASRRGIRRPVLVAAAVAAVIAAGGVAIPLSLRDTPAPPAAEEKDGDGLVWSRDYDWLQADGGPYVVATFTKDGAAVDAVVWLRDGDLCMAEGHRVGVGGSTDRTPGAIVGTSCVAVPDWPTEPGRGSYVVSRSVLSTGVPDSGPVPGLMVFMTAPAVEALEVYRGDGSYVQPERFETLAGATLYVADFKSSTQGFGYTARDHAGAVLESAIT
jgi:hypothetical protein